MGCFCCFELVLSVVRFCFLFFPPLAELKEYDDKSEWHTTHTTFFSLHLLLRSCADCCACVFVLFVQSWCP